MKKISMAFIICCLLTVYGCGDPEIGDYGFNITLPENPIKFEQGDYTNPNDKEDSYGTILYQNRVYLAYGRFRDEIPVEKFTDCVGYVVQKDETDKTDEIYFIKDDTNHQYLIEHWAESYMESPMIWRALDTKGKEIQIYDFIEPLGSAIWEEGKNF